VAVDVEAVMLWDREDLNPNLRLIAVPPSSAQEQGSDAATEAAHEELTPATVEQIRALAREHPAMTSREISVKLSLRVPMTKIAAHVAVARRKK
jgi:hypothetical protein